MIRRYETWTWDKKLPNQWDRHSCLSLVKSGLPVESIVYELPILKVLCFDIHPCNGGVRLRIPLGVRSRLLFHFATGQEKSET